VAGDAIRPLAHLDATGGKTEDLLVTSRMERRLNFVTALQLVITEGQKRVAAAVGVNVLLLNPQTLAFIFVLTA